MTVKNQVTIWDRVEIGDDCFIGPGVAFTNDRNPRSKLREGDAHFLPTTVGEGATIGANATLVAGIEIGARAFVGAGAVVCADLPAHAFAVGNPARQIGWACLCGNRLSEDTHVPGLRPRLQARRRCRAERARRRRPAGMSDAGEDARLVARVAAARSAMLAEELYGWDPYDALLSPLFGLPGLRSWRAPRLAAQQAVLRSPVNLRPLLRVPRQRNPVTLGLYVQGLADLAEAGALERGAAAAEAAVWIEALERAAVAGHRGACWGYPFPWEGRRHRMPADTPTVVATGIVVSGLHRAWRAFGDERARRMTISSAGFVLDELPRAAGDDRAWCWAYSSVDRQAVLNATMKGTRLLAQALDAGLDDPRAAPAAAASARFVAEHQEEDGGWPYAVEDPRDWRDHHHTGYVLECFDTYRRLSGERGFDREIERGWTHYREAFFDKGHLPRYYDDRPGPVDATAAGQALSTLAAFGDVEFGLAVAQASVAALGLPDGSFAYRRRRGRLTRTHFIRWSTAWMFAGMARLLAAEAAGG